MSGMAKKREKRSLYSRVARIHGCREDLVRKVAVGKERSAAILDSIVYLKKKEQEAELELKKILEERKALNNKNAGETTQIQKAS